MVTVDNKPLALEQINLVAQHTLDMIHRCVSKQPTSGHERNQRVALAIKNPELVELLLAIHITEPPRDPPHGSPRFSRAAIRRAIERMRLWA